MLAWASKLRALMCVIGILHDCRYSPARLSLTLKHLMPLLKGVCNWWSREEDDDSVFFWLGVPLSKQQEIREQCGSDEDKAVER